VLDIAWTGGSPEDQKAVAEQHEAYLRANAEFDWEKLRGVYSAQDFATFFNLNGHVYEGIEHWIRLWQYYINQQRIGYWTPYEMKGVMSGDLATVWCLRKTKSDWFGKDDPMSRRANNEEFISRSTMTFMREADGWRCVHVHFSNSAIGEERPGGV
jgi:hypothetical protein